MSTHPNVILMVALTPHALSRKTMAAILAEAGVADPEMDDIAVGERKYHHCVMEESFEEGYQIAAKEGDLVFFRFVTYGYGQVVAWADLEAEKTKLEAWAVGICERHQCDYRIEVTANYW